MRLILILTGRAHLALADWHHRQATHCAKAAQARKRSA